VAKLLIQQDVKVSLQEALGRAVDHALEDEGSVEELAGTAVLEEDYAWPVLEKPRHTGIKDLSKDIHPWVYGGR